MNHSTKPGATSTTRKIGICLIGCGRAGMIHGRNFARHVPGASVVSLVDASGESLAAAARELDVDEKSRHTDFRAALEDKRVDAVVVAAPSALHRDIVIAAARARKDILCEKPMAMNERECDEMIAAVEKHGVRLQLGFMRRFDASFRAAKARIDAGEIGDVVLVKSLTHGPSIPRPWMYDLSKSNGALSEVSSHDIDALRWYTGSEFGEVYAIAGNYRCPDAREQFPDFYDNFILNARFVNGMQGSISGAQAVLYGYDSRAEILGTRGLITVGRLEDNSVVTYTKDTTARRSVVESWRGLFSDAYLAEDAAFIECMLRDRAPEVGGIDGKMAVKVVNAGNQSIKERRPISLG